MYVDRYYVRKLIYFVMEEHNCQEFFSPFCKGRQGPDNRGDIIHAGMVSNHCLHHLVTAHTGHKPVQVHQHPLVLCSLAGNVKLMLQPLHIRHLSCKFLKGHLPK